MWLSADSARRSLFPVAPFQKRGNRLAGDILAVLLRLVESGLPAVAGRVGADELRLRVLHPPQRAAADNACSAESVRVRAAAYCSV